MDSHRVRGGVGHSAAKAGCQLPRQRWRGGRVGAAPQPLELDRGAGKKRSADGC